MRIVLTFAVLLLAGCGESPTPILGCDSGAGMEPDCRFQNPEDLAMAPRGGRLIVSQMGQMDGSQPGDIALYLPGGAVQVLFPADGESDDRSWGDQACPPPDLVAFSPHGIDLVQRSDGRWMLLVVNHGGRESVEFFEVTDQGGDVSLGWKGCAEGPGQASFNDVVGRRSGGFYVTHMMPRDSGFTVLLKGALFGADIGFVYAWDRTDGWTKVPGSDGPFPNGLALTADEQLLFINMYLGGEVRKLDLDRGEVVGVVEIDSPDNSTWSSDGRLLVASHIDGLMASTDCQGLEAGSCGFAFRIVALDPETLATETLIEHRGAPMGGATVALEMEGDLFLGTFAGDRVTRVPGGR
jgi:hypothetical protein